MQINMRILLLSFVFLSFTTCVQEKKNRKIKNFSSNVWHKNEIISLDMPSQQKNIKSVKVIFRYASGFYYNKMKLLLKIKDSEGTYQEQPIFIDIISNDGKYIGDGLGGIWDIEKEIYLERFDIGYGKDVFTLEHIMPKESVDYVMKAGLTLVLDESKTK